MARTLMPADVPQSSPGDDAVLRDVDQTAGEITRVRGLERGVGEALAGTVGRVEVLEHGEPFLEVGDDRALDDFARRLGHQAAHARELAHLRRRPARTGMRHHIDRVDLGIAAVARPFGGRDLAHHLVGDLLGALRPSVDDLVVLLALGDQALVVLLLELLGELRASRSTIFHLECGTTMSSLPNEMPALNAWWKPSAMMRSQKITVSFWPQKR